MPKTKEWRVKASKTTCDQQLADPHSSSNSAIRKVIC